MIVALHQCFLKKNSSPSNMISIAVEESKKPWTTDRTAVSIYVWGFCKKTIFLPTPADFAVQYWSWKVFIFGESYGIKVNKGIFRLCKALLVFLRQKRNSHDEFRARIGRGKNCRLTRPSVTHATAFSLLLSILTVLNLVNFVSEFCRFLSI